MPIATSASLPSIKFRSRATVAQTNVPVTFGQVFAPGDLMAGRGLIARAADGSYLPLQVDQKATHADGSVRHAIISCILPALAAGETQSLQLLDADKRASVQTFAGAPASVAITLAGVAYTAAIDPAAAFALWLTGPVVNEHQFNVPFTAADGTKHPHLMARFAVRDYGSVQRVDVTIENDWAFASGWMNFTYDAQITVAGQVVFTQAALPHYHHGRWRKVFWTGAAPQVHVQYDVAYLMATKAVPNYGTDAMPAETVMLDLARFALDSAPMRLGAASPYMPETGGNGEIGILPVWAWADILSQDARARDCTLVTGTASGSYSMHYRDQATGLPVALKDHPRMTIAGRSTDAGADAFPPPAGDIATPYTPDISHHPSLAYLPYLLTGDYYYLEELQFWAMWCAFSSNPGYRGAEQGLMIPEQLRGQAWGLRTIAQAAYATPDAHPLKAELARVLGCNHDWYNANYTNNPAANKIGVLTNGYSVAYDNETTTPTWMDDFFVQSLGHQIDLGFTKALPLLAWKSKFTLGRMLDVSWTIAAPYGLPVRDTSSSPVYDTIAQCYTKALGETFMSLPWASPLMASAWNGKGYPMNMYPTNGVYAGDMGNIAYGNMGYPSNLQPALALLVDYDIPGAKHAWDCFMSRSVKCDYTTSGQFNVEPRVYVAQPVAPYVTPTDATGWQVIAIEGQTVTVPDDTTVRYGANGAYVEKICGGSVTASNAFFGSDPAPNAQKALQKFIPSTSEDPIMTHKLSITAIAFGNQDLAFGTEAATSLLVELLDPNGVVLGSTATIPGDITGITFADLTAKHTIRASGLNGAGVMGKPALQDFVPQDYLPAVVVPVDPPADPTPTTAAYSLPSAVTFTLAAE